MGEVTVTLVTLGTGARRAAGRKELVSPGLTKGEATTDPPTALGTRVWGPGPRSARVPPVRQRGEEEEGPGPSRIRSGPRRNTDRSPQWVSGKGAAWGEKDCVRALGYGRRKHIRSPASPPSGGVAFKARLGTVVQSFGRAGTLGAPSLGRWIASSYTLRAPGRSGWGSRPRGTAGQHRG